LRVTDKRIEWGTRRMCVQKQTLSFFSLSRRPDVVDLKNHLDELGGEQELGLLAVQALDHVLLLHV
jgi:hypothetical protein